MVWKEEVVKNTPQQMVRIKEKRIEHMEPKFTKAKLSQESLDSFVRKYSTTKFRDFVPYTTKVGEVT